MYKKYRYAYKMEGYEKVEYLVKTYGSRQLSYPIYQPES